MILDAKNLSKTYQKRVIVDNVSLHAETGKIIGLLGPNGAGKTTCFYMLLGLIPADKGIITLDSHDITHYPIHKRARLGLGYLPQEPCVFKKLTVEENIYGVLEMLDLTKEQRDFRLRQLLSEFGLNNIKTLHGISLSGGERRRVEIARALAYNPQFILLDEPFAGVDPISICEIKEIILYLAKKGIGVIITDHNVRETLDICHKAYILNLGKVIASGSTNEILNNKEVRRVYLGESFAL